MQIEIITPDKTIFKGEAELVQLPGVDGYFEVLKNHAPLISVLGKGKIKVQDKDKNNQFYDIAGGVVEVLKNKLLILVD